MEYFQNIQRKSFPAEKYKYKFIDTSLNCHTSPRTNKIKTFLTHEENLACTNLMEKKKKRKHLIIQEDGNLTRKDCCTPLCRGHNT
jgi:hypothetical protein